MTWIREGPPAGPADACVFHLAWAPLGLEPFRRFLDSYRAHPAGSPHRLRILFNGFRSAGETGPYRELLAGMPHESLVLDEPVQDIRAYRIGAEAVGEEYLCYLNSHSVLLDGGWLAKLLGPARRGSVGLVGATGTHESYYTSSVALNPFPGPRLGRNPLWWRHNLRWWRVRLRERRRLFRWSRREFPPFPNPHLRTNAFIIRRPLMLGLEVGDLATKEAAYEFESGRGGLTSQVLRAGLEVLVVGRDGVAYAPEDWPGSETYRIGDQANLLVSDNQTRKYDEASPEERRFLANLSWGDRAADPAGPAPGRKLAAT